MIRGKKVAVVALALILGLGACNSSQPQSAKKGGILIWAQQLAVASLDVAREAETSTEFMEKQVYEQMMTVDPADPSKLDPQLASSWEANTDNTVFTFHLVKNAHFQSGNPVTAADIKFSYERQWNLQSGAAFMLAGYKSIDVVDPYTVSMTLNAPDASWLSKMASSEVPVIDSKLAIQNGGTSDKNAVTTDKLEPYFNAVHTMGLGSGPFVLTAYVPNVELDMKRNTNYWGPPPALDEIIMKDVPDPTAQSQLLQSGQISIAGNLDYTTAKQLESVSGIKISYPPGDDLQYLFMNTSPAVSKPLSNKLVRLAVSYAIDYNGLLALTNGHATQPTSTIPPGLLGADQVPPRKQDLAMAKQLMAQAGYPNGFQVNMVYGQQIVAGLDTGLLAAKLQADLAQIGIKLTLQSTTVDQFFSFYRGGKDPIGFAGFTPDYADPDDYTAGFWGQGNQEKRLHYTNPQIDALYPQTLATSGAARVQAYKQLQELILQDPPFIGLIVDQYILAYRDNVHGLNYIFDPGLLDLTHVSLS